MNFPSVSVGSTSFLLNKNYYEAISMHRRVIGMFESSNFTEEKTAESVIYFSYLSYWIEGYSFE